jgi:hypothetical protein
MAIEFPHTAWLCHDPKCHVYAFGRMDQTSDNNFFVSRCPKCSGIAVRSTREVWLVNMICGKWLEGKGVEYPQA